LTNLKNTHININININIIYRFPPIYRKFRKIIRLGRRISMPVVLTEDFIYEILSVVDEIPNGKVATYGQIARLTGREKNARLVGKVLSMSEYYGKYPCHRVVNHAGRLAPHFYEQKSLLLEEGVEFKDSIHVDMKKYHWEW
jgi:methylated-DNA-protein-cysteine methyltransferase-like protein